MGKFNNKRILLVILISIVVVSLATSAAYLLLPILPNILNPENIAATTDNLILTYTDCTDNNTFHCENISQDLGLGESVVKTFQIKNESNSKLSYTLYFKHLWNTFKNDELVYKIENIDTGEVLLDSIPLPYREERKANITIKEKIEIKAKSTQNYRMTITFLNKDYNQIENLNAKYFIKLSIVPDGTALEEKMVHNVLMATNDNYDDKLWKHKGDISKIVFEDTISSMKNASYTYDISNDQDGSVLVHLVHDTEASTKFIAYIQSDGNVKANQNSSWLFGRFSNLKSIENLNYFDTSNVSDMSYMFAFCESLSSLDLGSFDTSNVTNMYGIFGACRNLVRIDLSNFNTSQVTDMGYMFHSCHSLTTLNLSNFDTGSVTNMQSMFTNCSGLTSLNITNFYTGKVTNMRSMFSSCSGLTALDLSNFNTSQVTDMSSMFSSCSSLTSLNVSSFNTSNVTNMNRMFCECNKLTTTITIRGIKCTNYSEMFYNGPSNSTARITVNYTADASSLVDKMIKTNSRGYVQKGAQVA